MPANETPLKSAAPKTFNASLTRTVVITLLAISLLPVLLITGVTFLRTRSLLQNMVTQQLENTVATYSLQIENLAANRQKLLTDLMAEPGAGYNIGILIDPAANEQQKTDAEYWLLQAFAKITDLPGGNAFDNMLLVNPQGTILASTNPAWKDLGIGDLPAFQQVNGQTGSVMVFDFWPLYPQQMSIVSSFGYTKANTDQSATVVGVVINPLPGSLLESASTTFQRANSYFYTYDDRLVGIGPDRNFTVFEASDPAYSRQLDQMRDLTQSSGRMLDSAAGRYFAFAQWMPALKASFVTAVPRELALSQIRPLIPITLATVTIALVITGVLLFAGTTRVVNPLVQLANKARSFSKGDFSERAEVNRSDEIGLLAHSFNQMVEELSALYRSLEGKVEERTRQLRTAAEVASVATSVTDQQEMLRQTVSLIISRFGYHYAAVYLLDESGSYAVMQEVASVSEETDRLRGQRIPVSNQNAVGRVAVANQPLVTNDTSAEGGQGRTLLSRTRSQVILPIAIGQQVYGVLDVQSAHANSFEPETVAVMQTLAEQIATGLRNILLLASTQVNLEETSLLSRASRQITQSDSRDEVIQILTDTLALSPFVAAVLAVESDHLKLLSLHDNKGYSIDATIKGISLPLQKGAARLAEGGMVLAPDLKEVTEFENLFSLMARRDCRSGAAIPVLTGGQPTLVIALGSLDRRPLNATALQAYANLAEISGNTIERFEVLTTLEKRLTELETLKTVGETISAETSLEALFEVLQQQILQRMGTDLSFGVALFDPQTNLIEVPLMTNGLERLKLEPFPVGEGLTSFVIQEKKPLLLVRNTQQEAEALGARIVGKPAKSWMGVPLIAGGEVLGALILQDTNNEERFTPDDLTLFNTLAPQIANIIRNARLLNEMSRAIQAYDQERFLLNTLLTNIPERVFFKDRDGQYLRVSLSYAQCAGIENPVDLIGRSDVEIFGEAIGLARYEADQQVLLEGESQIGQVVRDEAASGEAWFLDSRIPMTDEQGEVAGLLGLSQEITELKQAELLTERRAQQLQTAAEIARETISTLQVNEILRKGVELVRDRFGYYHASIFLIDAGGDHAVLRESSGEIGQRMMQIGHKLAVGSHSLVGQATATGNPVVVNNVRRDPNYYANPLTPDTNSEAVIPLKAGDRVLGAMDVQSTQLEAFNEDDIHTLSILADQLAVAVVNANLFAKTEEHLAKHRLLHHITSAATASNDLAHALTTIVDGLSTALPGNRIMVLFRNDQGAYEVRASAGYEQDLSLLRVQPGEGIIGLAASEKRPVRVVDTESEPLYVPLVEGVRSEIAVPILFMDEVIGVLNIESEHPNAFDENDQEILGTLGNSLGAIIANARLITQVRQQTERQKQLFEITSRIRRSVDVNTILKTSAAELARVVQANRARIEITAGKAGLPQVDAPVIEQPAARKNGKSNGHHGPNGKHAQEAAE